MKIFALVVNYVVLLLLIASLVSFVQHMNPFGFFMALVNFAIAVAVWKKNRWGYFALAAFGLACFQLAKQELAFIDVKRYAMIFGFLIIPVAVFLHEVLAQKKINNDQGPGAN
jgi:hypothetical protein